jgi:energy-coupling factor transporter ATP-binding protein EcfA2
VTQELHEAMPYADRLIVLDEGRVAADGPPDSVLQEPARLSSLGVKLPDLIAIATALEARGRWAGPMPLTLDAAEAGIRRSFTSLSEGDTYKPASGVARHGDPIVRFENVRFGYAGGTEILQGINLEIGPGEFVAVMGANGAGKTTIAKHLNGLLRPVSGRVLVDGKDTRKHPVAQMAASVGYVFQNPDHQIVCRHLGEELALGPVNCGWSPQQIEAATARVLRLFGFTDRNADPFFMGLAERNLVALATALMMEPRILVLDEPATGADHGVITRLMTRVAELNCQGLTVVMVTHDAALVAEYARRLVVVKDGQVALDGSPADVFRAGAAINSCRVAPPPTLELCVRLADLGMPPFVSASQAIGALSGSGRLG